MCSKLMNLALMMAATTTYASEYKDPFSAPRYNLDDRLPKGTIPSDNQKCQPKEQHKFVIKGIEIMAASRKDAIKKYNHLKESNVL